MNLWGEITLKKLLALVLALLMMMTIFVGCGEKPADVTADEVATQEATEVSKVNLTLNAFTNNGVEYKFIVDDSSKDVKEQRINTISFVAKPEATVGEILSNNGYSNFKMDEVLDKFIGFMEYKIIVTEGEDGTRGVTYEKVSDTLYTVEELLEKEVSDYDVTFVAKWESLSDDYYAAFGY